MALFPMLLALLGGADPPSAEHRTYRATAEAYLAALAECDRTGMTRILAAGHRAFVITGNASAPGAAVFALARCRDGKAAVRFSDPSIKVDDHGSFGSASIEVTASDINHGNETEPRRLRISLMMEDMGSGPAITRSHLFVAPAASR